MNKVNTIGHTECIEFLDYPARNIIAKVDTGADGSSIWASNIALNQDGSLTFVLFGEKSPHYTGETITVRKGEYKRVWITNSFGDRELRFVVKLRVRIQGRVIRASFSLADRSNKPYPILLGKRFLHKKFLVDVSRRVSLKKQFA